MSKGRNRNIKRKVDDKNFHDDHLPTTWLGDYIFSGTGSTYEEETSFYQDVDTIDNLSVGKSSSSSLSWGEDCEIETTQKVKREYDKMNSIICGLQPIPPHYDKDEYRLWIKTFPCLRLKSSTEKKSNLVVARNISQLTNNKCDNLSSNTSKSAVIDDLLNKMCNKLTNSTGDHKALDRRKNYRQKQSKIKNENNTIKNTLQDDFSTLLRISPAPTYSKFGNLEKRRRSTNYVDAVNYANSNNREYSSLPHLLHGDSNFSHSKSKHLDSMNRNTRKRQYANKVVLPPIDVSFNQFRSISAIPLQQNKCSSALSTKTNFLVGFNNTNIVSNSSLNKGRLNGFY